jgi:hypothetical protein
MRKNSTMNRAMPLSIKYAARRCPAAQYPRLWPLVSSPCVYLESTAQHVRVSAACPSTTGTMQLGMQRRAHKWEWDEPAGLWAQVREESSFPTAEM